jgi:hypothetical protein
VDVVVDRALINVLQGGAKGSGGGIRHYRLVDQQGCPHPVLDDLYDSLDAAWDEARQWWREHVGSDREPVGIGIEVSTACGSWRTLRYPGC